LTYWKGYRLNREVIDLGSTTVKIRGDFKTVLDVPIPGAKFSVFETGTTTLVKEVFADASGKYSAAGLAAGDYDLKWEMTGYVTQTETNVHLGAGKELNRKIVLIAV
jgi:hypothetical protein